MTRSTKLYTWLLRLYPARFREEYQTPMERQFLDEYRETRTGWDRARLWRRALWDVALSAPGQLFSELTLDLKHATRVYRSRSLSALLAILALALAIGASTGVFSVLNALLLRGLPFSNPESLAELWFPPVTPANGRSAFLDWSRHSSYLAGATAFSSVEMNLAGEREAFRVKVAETSANFFALLGSKAAIGRTFAPDEDIPGRNAVAVISYSLWQQLSAADPEILGKSVHLNGIQLTVIGVAPPGFDYPGKTTIWIPTVFDFEKVPKRGAFLFQVIGRLKHNLSIRTAGEMFQAEIRRTNPAALRSLSTEEENRPRLVPLRNQLAGPVRQASWSLAAMTLLVLLTACANVAQLMLSRATERRQELALRSALGASPARLFQQLITEAMFLTVIGAALGLLIAQWTSRIASSAAPAQLAVQQYTILDWRVLGFATALAVLTGLVFGVMPAWLIGRLGSSGNLMRSRPGAPDRATKRTRTGLLVIQAALTLCLLTSSLALGRAFLQLLNTNLGFRTQSVVTLNVSLEGTIHSGRGEWQYYSEALERLRALPGVEAAGAVSYLPLAANIYMASSFKLDSGQTLRRMVMNAVTPDYFRAMGTTFLAGHDFPENEAPHSEPSVIVNQAFARQAGLASAIVGRRLLTPWTPTPYLIAGVVATARFSGPADPGAPEIYWQLKEEPPPRLTLVASVRGPAQAYVSRCRDAVRAIDPRVPVYDAKTLDQRLDEVLARPRFYTTAMAFLATLALVLAVVGIYGTTAYSVAQRRHEMGVRMAVGASHGRVRAMVLRTSMAPVAGGMAAGVALSIASGRYLKHILENTAGPAFTTCAAACGFLLLAGLISAWVATSGVLSVDPAEALRIE